MKELITPEKLQIQIKILAKQLSDDHKNDKTPVVAICILNGGFMFFTDFVRAMPIDLECDFIRVKSYVSKRKQGDIQITKDLEIPIKNKHVYIIDDIVDTGKTMFEILLKVNDMRPTDVKVVTLLKRKKDSPPVDHFCFEIDDEWVVGYGLDDNSLKRNYRNIYKLK